MNNSYGLNEIWQKENNIKREAIETPLDVASKIANLYSSGRYFYLTMNFTIGDVDFVSDNVQSFCGIEKEKFNLHSWIAKWHTDDSQIVAKQEQCKANFLFNFIAPTEIINYKICQKYRMQVADGSYKLFLNQASTILLSKDFKIQKSLLVQTDITHLDSPISKRVSFIHTKGGKSYYSDDLENFIPEGTTSVSFSIREQQILSLTSKGMSAHEIADKLYISKNTVDTHKRNILARTDCKNMIEVVSKSIRSGWI